MAGIDIIELCHITQNRWRLDSALIEAMFSVPVPRPTPKSGTLEEFYGDWKGFVAVMEATSGRKIIATDNSIRVLLQLREAKPMTPEFLEKLRRLRANPSYRTSSEAYAQMDRSMAASRRESVPTANKVHCSDFKTPAIPQCRNGESSV